MLEEHLRIVEVTARLGSRERASSAVARGAERFAHSCTQAPFRIAVHRYSTRTSAAISGLVLSSRAALAVEVSSTEERGKCSSRWGSVREYILYYI